MSEQISLVVNAGSSSIKLALYEGLDLQKNTQFDGLIPQELIEKSSAWIAEHVADKNIQVVAHRIVHGGSKFSRPTEIDDAMRAELEELALLDPDHMPVALQIVDLLKERMPNASQIACFDTAFFHDLPRVAQIIALPRKFESIGIRKYGFHGLSYQYLLESLKQEYGVDVAKSRIVCAHLGSGTSVAAIKNGVPIDTAMSVTPSSGVPMSSRSGDIDPGIVGYLHKKKGLSADDFQRITSSESGLLGISETTADMYTLLQQEDSDIRSKEAVDVYCYEVKKAIGSLTAVLGGIDILVFSGGIGEKAPLIRQRICTGLDYLGIHIDLQKNEENQARIHNESGPVQIFALHTNEEQIIAKQVHGYLKTILDGDIN